MSRRLNIYGFSMARMRGLLGSGDAEAVRRLRGELANRPGWEADAVGAVVERAIMDGVPFPDLIEESSIHANAAAILAADGQDLLVTDASVYHAEAMEDGLWPVCRKHGRPEARAFVRGLVEGLPLFGPRIEDEEGSPYAMIGLEKLRIFRPGLGELRDLLNYRVEQNAKGSAAIRDAAGFATEFVGWIDQVMDAGLDLWYATD